MKYNMLCIPYLFAVMYYAEMRQCCSLCISMVALFTCFYFYVELIVGIGILEVELVFVIGVELEFIKCN